MFITSLAIIVSTCLSGPCLPLATSYQLEEINNSAYEIVEYAKDHFDYSNYDLTYDEQQSLIKQKIYNFAKSNKVLSSEQLEYLKKEIVSSFDFTYFDDIDSLFVKDNILESPSISKEDFNHPLTNMIKLNDKAITNKFSNSTLDLSGGSNDGTISSVDKAYKLPLLYCNEDNISVSFNGNIDGTHFIGIICSKDACVSLYNLFAGFINSKATRPSNMGNGLFETIVVGFEYLETKKFFGPIASKVLELIETIKGALLSIWNSFISLIEYGDIVCKVVGAIIGVIGAICIAVIAAMIVYGYLGKGYYIGWMVYNLFSWHFVSGELD